MVYTDVDMPHIKDSDAQPDQAKHLRALTEKAEAERNPQQPFEPKCIDLTPTEPANIGYVGGVRLPKKNR
jgi:hypothetical protein